MKIPREFAYVVGSLYVGSLEECSSLEEWAAGAANRVHDKHILDGAEQFLEQFLGSNPSTQELQKVWNGSGPSYFLRDEVVGPFLHLLLAALKARAAKEEGERIK